MKATLVRAIAGTTILAGAIAAATAAAPVTRSNPLRVSMFATGNGGVEVILTNTSTKIARVRVPKLKSNPRPFKVLL